MDLFGAIEFGGTKTVCAIGTPGRIVAQARFPTGEFPARTLAACTDFLTSHGPLRAVGVGAFGPCDPDPASATFGSITTTPKPGWAGTDVLGPLRRALTGTALAFDTDVNAAAVGEMAHGAGRGLDSLVYLTIGTGIGGGVVVGGQPVHGLIHPEVGHMRIPRPAEEAARFPGVCPFHGDCLEGLASGPALAARWGAPPETITPDDDRYAAMWALQAEYVASGLHNTVCAVSPRRIIVGGGVGARDALLDRVRPRLALSLAGYVDHELVGSRVADYVVPPGLGDRSGVLGAIQMAADAAGGP